MNNYFNNRNENKEIISKGMTIGITHIDTPVIFQLKTAIQPMAVQSIGMSPIIHSVIKDTPFISFTLQLDKDKDFLYREILKCIKVTGGLIPIRSYELTQFIYPVEENPGIYAGVGSKLIPLSEAETFTTIGTRTTKVQIDEIFAKFARNELNIEEYADFFYKKYIPWYNVAYCQLYNPEGNAPILEMFVQPVDMFAYFPDGISLFLKDDDGVVLQEALQRYMNVHQGHILNPEMHKFFNNFSNMYDGTKPNPTVTDHYGSIRKELLDTTELKKISQPQPIKFTDFVNRPNTKIDFFSSDSKLNFTYTTKSFSADGQTNSEENENLIDLIKHDSLSKDVNLASLYTDEIDTRKYNIVRNSEEIKQNSANILVEDGDTIETIYAGDVDWIEDNEKVSNSFRIYGLDTLETLKNNGFADPTKPPSVSNDSQRYQMQLFRILSRTSIGDFNPISGTKIETDLSNSISIDMTNSFMTNALNNLYTIIHTDKNFDRFLDSINENFLFAYWFVAEMGTSHLHRALIRNKQGTNFNNYFIDYSKTNASHNRYIATIPNSTDLNSAGLSLSSSYLYNYYPVNVNLVISELMEDTVTEFSKKLLNYLYAKSGNELNGTELEKIYKKLNSLLELNIDPNKDSLFRNRVVGLISGMQKCNNNLAINKDSTFSNFNYMTSDESSRKYYAIYSEGNSLKNLTLVAPSDPVSINKIVVRKPYSKENEDGTTEKDTRVYNLDFAICLHANNGYIENKKDNKLYNSFVTISDKQLKYPKTITASFVPDEKLYVLSTSAVFNSRDTINSNYIFTKLYVINDYIFINDSDLSTFSLKHSPEKINSVINEIQSNHLTLYPELSQPFRKLINSIDENFIENRKIYKYTYTNTKEAYPLLHTNNGIFSKQSKIDNSDVIFTYNSQNKLNTDIIESLKFSLNYLFFELEKGYKNLFDEFDLSPRPNESYRLFYDPVIGGNTYFTYEGTQSNKLFRTYGNTLSDFLYCKENEVKDDRKICVNFSAGDITKVVRDAFDRSGGEQYRYVLPMFQDSISDVLSTIKSNKIKSNIFIDKSTFVHGKVSGIPTYKEVFDRLRDTTIFALTLVKKVAEKTKNNSRDSYQHDVYISEINQAILDIENIYKNISSGISTSKITTVDGVEGNSIDLSSCETETAISLVSISQEMTTFSEALNEIKDIVLPLTLSKPLTYISKKLIINNNNDTSIISANYIYESNNTPITNSQNSVGSYFQHTGSTQERVILSIRTSSFTLMRQLMLMYYTNDFVSKNILDMEKSRSAYTEIQKTPVYTLLKNRAEKTFSQITKSDLESVDFDYSFKIENDFLNSYGIRFGFIEDITINSVENKVGLYNMNIIIVKTNPRELSNSNIKSFNKAPFKNVVTEHLISKALEEYNFGANNVKKLPNLNNISSTFDSDFFKYNELMAGTAGVSFVAIATVAALLYSIVHDKKYSTLRRYIGFKSFDGIEKVVGKKVSEILDDPNRDSIVDLVLALTSSLLMTNHSDFITMFVNLNTLISELKYPSANSSMKSKQDIGISSIAKEQLEMAINDLSYFTGNTLFKNIYISPGKTFSSLLSKDEDLTSSTHTIVMKTINEMFDFYSTGNYDYFSYMHYLCLGMKYGFQKIKFKYELPINDINSIHISTGKDSFSKLLNDNLKDKYTKEQINTILYKYGEIHELLNQAISLYEYDNNQYKTETDIQKSEYKLNIDNSNPLDSSSNISFDYVGSPENKSSDTTKYTSEWTVETLKVLKKLKSNLTANITNETKKIFESISNEYCKINNDNIEFYIPYTPTFIRILHSFQTIIRAHGFNTYSEIEELDPLVIDKDSDSYDSPITKQLIEFFVTNNFNKYYSNLNIYKDVTHEIEEDEVRNHAIKKLIHTELKYIHLLNSKIVMYNTTDTYNVDEAGVKSKTRTPLVSTYDVLTLQNSLPENIKKSFPIGNMIRNTKFSDNFINYLIINTYNPVTNKETGFNKSVWIQSLNTLVEKLSIDNNVFSKQIMERSPDLKKNRYFTSLSEYINVSLFGTSINIISSISEQVYKNEITPTIFSGKEAILSFLMCNDVYYWTSSSLMFGTFGGNNPYTSSYYSEGNYAQSMLPSVYCLPKSTIIKYLRSPELDDLSFHLILKSMLMGSKVNTNPAFYIYDQQTLDTIYTYMSQQSQDLSSNIQNALVENKPLDIKENIRLWVSSMKDNIIKASSSLRQLKQYINMIIGQEQRTMPDIISRLDAVVELMMTINMYVYQEEYILTKKENSEDKDSKRTQFEKERQQNQEKLDQVNSIMEDILSKNIYSIYEAKENTVLYKNLQSMVNTFMNDMLEARRSVQLLDEFDAIGGISAIDLNYQEQIAFIMNESNNLSDTFKSIIQTLQTTSYSNISSPVHNNQMYNSILKDFSSGTSEKKIHLSLAYPIVKILFTKEDIPDMLVFDEMFLYTNVVSVITHSTIKTSSSVATITVADPFDDLHNTLSRRLARRRSALNPFEVSPSSNEGLSSFSFEVGTSIQIRMGYSRYLGEDSVVFNGTVASINNDPTNGTKIINCNNFGSNLLTPYKSTSENITNDDSWWNVFNNKDKLDNVDHTIAFGYLQQVFFNRPEAFNGLIRTNRFNSMNKSSEADSIIINRTSNRNIRYFGFSMPGTNVSDVYDNKDKIDKLLYFSGFASNKSTSFLENFKPLRPSTDTNILLPSDFVYEGNKSVWNILKQMQLHYMNHYLLIRPLDNAESIVFTPLDSTYKFSTSMLGSNYSFEKFAEKINPSNQKDSNIVTSLYKMFKEKIPQLESFSTVNMNDEQMQNVINAFNINYKSDEFVTLFIIASSYRSFIDKTYKNSFTTSNSIYSDVVEYLKNNENRIEIIVTFSKAYSDFKTYKTLYKDLYTKKEVQSATEIGQAGLAAVAGSYITSSGATISSILGLSSSAATSSTALATAGAAIGTGSITTVAAPVIAISLAVIGSIILIKKYAPNLDNTSEEIVINTNKFLRKLYDDTIILSKNYRKVSAIHSIYSPSIVFNDIQVLENANTISMSYFNPSTAIGGTLTQISKFVGGGIEKVITGGNGNTGTKGTNVVRNLLNFFTNLDERNVNNLSDTAKWINIDFSFHEYLPGDKRRSTITIQPNAAFLQQLGVREDVVVASNIMRHVMNEYYGGNLVLIGNPGIYVADKIYLNDSTNKMSGVIECREVSNIFSATTGFITSITPSMVVNSDESILSGKKDRGTYVSQLLTQILLPVFLFSAIKGLGRQVTKGAGNILNVKAIGSGEKRYFNYLISKLAPTLNPLGGISKDASLFKNIASVAGRAMTLSFASKIFSTLIGVFNKTINYPMRTVIDNTPVTQNIIVLEKRGEPLISNLEGLDKAELLKRKKSMLNFRIDETIRQVMDIPSDDFKAYKKLLEDDKFDI